jgi:hypothetical protein
MAAALAQAIGEIRAADAKLAQWLGNDLRPFNNQFPARQQPLKDVLNFGLLETAGELQDPNQLHDDHQGQKPGRLRRQRIDDSPRRRGRRRVS